MASNSRCWSNDLVRPGSGGSKSAEFGRVTETPGSRALQLLRQTSSGLSTSISTGTFGHSRGISFNVDRPLDNAALPDPAIKAGGVSEADLAVLRELESDDVVVDRGDSIRVREVAAEAHRQQDSDDERSDGTDLKSQLKAACVKADGGRIFLPASELDRLLSEQRVRKVLLATNPDLPAPTVEQLLSAMRPGVSPKSSMRKIFAILVLLGKPETITDLFSAGVNDGNLPLSVEAIRKVWTHGAPEEFESLQWRVLAPFFGKSSQDSSRIYHYQLDNNVILPFISDNGGSAPGISGGFGEVRRVKIHADHHNMSKFSSSTPVFAVKTLRGGRDDDLAFAHEVSALKRFGGQTEHLVKLLATFNHRGSRHLLFHWADGGNLRDMWKFNPDPENMFLAAWIGRQLLGLATALHAIHTHSADGTKTTGYRHGDIKPQNILWFTQGEPDRGVLRISDFGLARFQDTRLARRPEKLMGTPTYRAPEFDLEGEPISRSIDVWSLGCVFLEFVTWYLLGPDGVMDEFPRSRKLPKKQLGSVQDDSFFTIESGGDTSSPPVATLKLSVKEQFRKLRLHPRTSLYISDLLDLIEDGMMAITPEDRDDSATCVRRLTTINEKVKSDPGYCMPLDIVMLEREPSQVVSYSRPRRPSNENIMLGHLHHQGTGQLDFMCYEHDIEVRSRLERLRIWVDQRLTPTNLDWWPLPPVKRQLPRGHTKLTWTYGGHGMSILLDSNATKRWKDGLARTRNPGTLPFWRPPQPTVLGGTSSSSAANATSQNQASYLSRWVSRISMFWTRPAAGAGGQTTTSNNPPNTTSANGWKESYLCVDKCWTSATETKVTTIASIDSMADDYALFTEARRVLRCARGNWLQRFFSWRSYTRVSLSQFHFLFNNSDRVKAFDYFALKIASNLCCQGYEYTSQHPEVDIHMQIMAEILLQGIKRPDLGRGQRTALDGIPKLKAPPSIKKQALISGWGFHAGQGPSLLKMCSWFLLVVVVGLVFVPVWLSLINPVDLQNAFTPVSFLITVVGGLFAIGASV